jgi:tRNA threonylcarbamoyladenosine biosynthesis protein TsaB
MGSIALGSFERRWNKLAMHSEIATIELQEILKEAGKKLEDVSGFAVNIGPGSFTGLRVGINLVRTLAYALEKPVATFTSLEAIAFENGKAGEKILVAIKAIQNFYYAGAYEKTADGMRTLVEPFSAAIDEVRAKGPYDRTIVEGLPGEMLIPSAKTLVAMSVHASFSKWNSVKPLYVRASEAEEKLKKGLLKPLP